MTHSAMLDELERDVERARARLAEDIARLRSPATLSHARADLVARATDYKDQLVERVNVAVSDRTHSFTETLRRQAQENPAAVAVMGMGIAWRLWKKPPITSLLLGAGLMSLLAGRGEERWSSSESGGFIESVRGVNRATSAFTERATDVAGDLAQQARDFSDRASATLSETAERASDTLAEMREHQRKSLRENPVALSFAAMAVGAALALALSRRE